MAKPNAHLNISISRAEGQENEKTSNISICGPAFIFLIPDQNCQNLISVPWTTGSSVDQSKQEMAKPNTHLNVPISKAEGQENEKTSNISACGPDQDGLNTSKPSSSTTGNSGNPSNPEMAQPITELEISVSKTEEQDLEKRGFTSIHGDLNCGTAGPTVTLWYKKGSDKPVTRIQFTFRAEMINGLSATGFKQINKNLNTGNTGDTINLWYLCGSTGFDIPIVDLHVSTNLEDEAKLVHSGWERLGCDLNRSSDGHPVYLWVKRSEPTYIASIVATTNNSDDVKLIKDGYWRVDEDLNREAKPAGSQVFLWYRHSKVAADGITDICVSLNEDEEESFADNFKKIDKNLNSGTDGPPVFLWHKHGQAPPIQYLTVLAGNDALKAYKTTKVKVVEKNLNKGNFGIPLYVALY